MSLDTEKKYLILEKAKDMIIADGYSKLSISKLTSELDISKGSFYIYFSSKDEMLGKILDEYTVNIKSFIENLEKNSNSVDEYLNNYIDTVTDLSDEDLKLELTIVNLRSNYEILNEENYFKIKEIGRILILGIENTLKKYLTNIKVQEKDLIRCSKIIFSITEVFTMMETVDFERNKFTVKSIEEMKKIIRSQEMKENLEFIKNSIKKIIY
nr:TetR/AcrR family transcriptional regulator [uncultured Fusobacterium sp.]